MKLTKRALINSLDPFTRAYITCALWSSNDESTPEGGEPMDRNYSIEHMTIPCLVRMQEDCNRFRVLVKGHLDICPGTDEQNGHDFWLTRNGHGAGFWDRGYPDPIGKVLTNCSKLSFGEADLYIHRGKVYHA